MDVETLIKYIAKWWKGHLSVQASGEVFIIITWYEKHIKKKKSCRLV